MPFSFKELFSKAVNCLFPKKNGGASPEKKEGGVCPVFFLLDASISMNGEAIGAVNSAMREILPYLQRINEKKSGVVIKAAALVFGGGEGTDGETAYWHTGSKGLAELSSFRWTDIKAFGKTPMGAAFRLLDAALRDGSVFMRDVSAKYSPLIFLMSDGKPTDGSFNEDFAGLKSNSRFAGSAKIALGYGNDVNEELMREFTGGGSFIRAFDPKTLNRFFALSAERSSQMAHDYNSLSFNDVAPQTHNTIHVLQDRLDKMFSQGNWSDLPAPDEDFS